MIVVALYVQAQQVSLNGAIAVALLSIAVSAATHYVVGTRAAARIEGITMTRLNNHDQQFTEVKNEQRDQWTKINDTKAKVDRIEGQLSVKTKVAHA